MTKFEGAMTAIVTPMTGSAVDYDGLAKLIERQLEAGIDGIVAVGTTGESATLSVAEHVEVIKSCVKFVDGKVPVIAGAGANSTSEAIELSKASEEAGAEALLHVCPYYNRPSQSGMIAHFATIAGATELPIILYNVPGRTSSDLSTDSVKILCDVPNIVGIKDATGDAKRGAELIAACGDRLSILSGDDFTAYSLYALGGKGVISVVSNVTPAWVAQTWDAVASDDLATARTLHYKMLPLVEMLFAESNPVPCKAALAALGHIEPIVRLPLTACSEELTGQLAAWLSQEGIK